MPPATSSTEARFRRIQAALEVDVDGNSTTASKRSPAAEIYFRGG